MCQGHSLGGAPLRPVRWQWHMNIYLDDHNMLSHCHAYFSPFMCGKTACVVEQLEAADFFSASIPKSRLFITVHDAVLYILKKRGKADFVLVGHHEYSSHFWLLCLFITCNCRNTFFEIFYTLSSGSSHFFQDLSRNTQMWPAGVRFTQI